LKIVEGSRSNYFLIALLLTVPLLAAAWQVDLPGKWGIPRDSAVYYAMAESLAWDYDLRYTREDLIRITKEWPGGPQGVLLVADDRHPEIIHYAKPVLYPLMAAPFVRIFGTNGLLILNAICFGLILYCGFIYFFGNGQPAGAGIVWTTIFWGLSVFTAYIFSLTPIFSTAAMSWPVYCPG